MSKKLKPFGEDPDRMRDILEASLKSTPESMDPDELSERCLLDYLDEAFPPSPEQLDGSSAPLDRLTRMISSSSIRTIRDMLIDPKTTIGELSMIKETFKIREDQSESKPERHAATVVYFAAISHALKFHKQKITQYSNEELCTSFKALAKRPWIPPALQDLFEKAKAFCS